MKFKLPQFKLPQIKFPKIKLSGAKRILSPKILIAIAVVAGIIVVVSLQSKLTARLFKKPEAKKEARMRTEEEALPQEPVLVKAYKAQKKDFEDNLPLLGTVKGVKEIDLKFETAGIIDSFNFKEGERIEEGEIIATLNQTDALLKLKYNEIELEKNQKLFDIGAIAKPKLDQVKVEMESAKRELDKTYLYAPRSGVLGAKDAEVGEFAATTEKVATLIDNKEVFVEVGIIEKEVGKIKIGQDAKVMVDSYPDTEFQGAVDSVSPVIEGKARMQTARIKVKNPKGELLPGMFARALVAVYKTQAVVVIPNTAIDKTEEGYVTYVVKKTAAPEAKNKEAKEEAEEEEGVAEARPIKAAYRSAEFFVVEEGLEDGDLVVVETQEKLKDGFKVIVTETQDVIF